MINKSSIWFYWSAATVLIVVYFLFTFNGDDKKVFTPGEMTHGHYQIEMSCESCHTDSFGGGEVLQAACVNCHGEELKSTDDSHPKSKFTNPRNALRVKELDARVCVTCHSEHNKEITAEMGVTLPEDFCFKCHQDVAEDRVSHKGMAFTTCANGGCHNYHDNSSLYEDFLEKHIDEKNHLDKPVNENRSMAAMMVLVNEYPLEKYPLKKLSDKDIDSDVGLLNDDKVNYEWSVTAHANAGVNCSACHQEKQNDGELKWIKKPSEKSCQSCHTEEVKGFVAGKHGMRIEAGLERLKPGDARQPMKSLSHNKELSCVSCHSAHKFDVKHAAVDACISCHDDEHSRSYKESPHFKVWNKEMTGSARENSGVSCATCHMPRTMKKIEDHELVYSEHNQNLNLRPNEKMIRSVCMNCHGLGFSIDALADKSLIKKNFKGMPSIHVDSIDMVNDRLMERKNRRRIVDD